MGPWGGVVHDLKNQSSGSDTLFAATGNGIYSFPNRQIGGYLWEGYPDTVGLRVLKVAPVPAGGKLYAIAVVAADPFAFAQDSQAFPPSGNLYELNISSGAWTDLSLSDVTAITVNGSGELLAGTWDGKLYRFAGGILTQVTIPLNGTPVRDIMAVSGSPDIYMVQGMYFDPTGTCFVYRSPDGGNTWDPAPEFSRNDGVCLSLGLDSSGKPLLGTEGGVVWSRSSGSWSFTPYGTGLPPYPVISFGSGPGDETFAVLRDHTWYDISSNPGPAGIYEMPSSSTGSWVRWDVDTVSTRIRTAVAAAGDLWLAFDQAGIYRVPGGNQASLPGHAADEHIAAVCLGDMMTQVSNGLALAPGGPTRVLAFGPSGVYELRNGSWNRILLADFENLSDSRTIQWTRENGFLSGSFSEDDPDVIWLGGEATGLLRGVQNPSGSFSYDWTRVHGGTMGRGIVNDIDVDPFDSKTVMWATGNGIYITTDDGVTVSPANINYGGQSLAIDVVDIAHNYLEPQWRSYLAGYNNGTSTRPGLLFSDNSTDWSATLYRGMSVLSVGFNPMPGSPYARGVAGASYGTGAAGLGLIQNGNWQLDPSVGLPSFINPNFRSLAFPFGADGDLRQDAFAVIWNSSKGIYWSSATADQGTPGESWTDITAEPGISVMEALTPVSVLVDPKDGNLLWAATREGSAFTLTRDHFDDNTPPFFPLHPSMPPGVKMDCLGSEANTLYLGWMAPGDDGDLPGWAARYELRCSDTVLASEAGFSAYGTVVSSDPPAIAHREEIVPVDIADCSVSSSTVSFALRALDEQGQASVVLTTGLFAPMAREPIEDLNYSLSGFRVDLAWDVSGLAGDPFYQNYGSLVIERGYLGEITIFGPMDSSTQQWSDDGADVGGFQTGDSILYTVKAMDGAGNLAAASVIANIDGGNTSGGGGGGGGCFIATASYGSPMEPQVEQFRSYRDIYLANHAWGRIILKMYYAFSPAPARFIGSDPTLGAASRTLLKPILWSINHTEPDSPVPAMVGIAIFIVTLVLPVFLLYLLLLFIHRIWYLRKYLVAA